MGSCSGFFSWRCCSETPNCWLGRGPWGHGLGGCRGALLCRFEEVVIFEHLARDPQLLQLHVLAQLTQVIHVEDLLPELEADEGLEEDEQSFDEHGRMHNVQGLDVLLILAVKLPVGVTEPAEGGLVVTGQAVVQIQQRVVTLHILVQGVLQVPQELAVVQLVAGGIRQALNTMIFRPYLSSPATSTIWCRAMS